jgi:16S rRNA G527 N7-methylase RsmG
LRLYPDEKLIKERKAYFEEINRKNEDYNLKYSENRLFQNEILNTLKIVFENDFGTYLE